MQAALDSCSRWAEKSYRKVLCILGSCFGVHVSTGISYLRGLSMRSSGHSG